jgi:hypothetical protein
VLKWGQEILKKIFFPASASMFRHRLALLALSEQAKTGIARNFSSWG